VGELFKAITGGLARFVFSWLVPSIVTLGLFWIFVLPSVRDAWPFRQLAAAGAGSDIRAGIVFAFVVLVLSILFAYTSLPIYRFLEGYSLPKPLQRRFRRKQLEQWRRIRWLDERSRLAGQRLPGLDLERIKLYPLTADQVAPTRLGNALRAMETFGYTRYRLDSQSLWFELQAVVPETTRRNTEEGRAPVDFFVSSIAHMTVLSTLCLIVGISSLNPGTCLIGLGAAATVPLSYRLAVRNVKDWGHAVKALVNLGRIPLALQMGLSMPDELAEERNMWLAYMNVIERYDARFEEYLDYYRAAQPSAVAAPESAIESAANESE
jgi:hypothetical protein